MGTMKLIPAILLSLCSLHTANGFVVQPNGLKTTAVAERSVSVFSATSDDDEENKNNSINIAATTRFVSSFAAAAAIGWATVVSPVNAMASSALSSSSVST